MNEYTVRESTENEITDQVFVSMESNLNTERKARARVECAEVEGHKNEACSCESVVLACHQFIRCSQDGCPMRSDKTIFDMMADDSK